MTSLLLIAAGGALGAVARYGVSGWVQNVAGVTFPWGTMTVNVTGSLFLGVVIRLLADATAPPHWRAFLAIGFLGAYTTFSTLTFEAAQLLRDREWTAAAGYLVGSVAVGLAAVLVGMGMAEWYLRGRG